MKQRGIMIGFRLERELIERVEALCGPLSTPWRAATRSDALRWLLQSGLEEMEAQESKPRKSKRSKSKGGR